MFRFLRKKEEKAVPVERSPRLSFLSADKVRFETFDGNSFPLTNLSSSGFRMEGTDLSVGRVLTGELKLPQIRLPIEAEIVRCNQGGAGARFTKGAKPVAMALARFFEEELKALEMTEVASEYLQGDSGEPMWFYAPGSCELYLMAWNGKVQRAQIAWADRLVLAQFGMSPRSGRVPESLRNEPSHAKANLVSWDEAADPHALDKAQRIVENTVGLPAELKADILGLLSL